MLSTRQKKKLLRRHLIISTSLAVQRENFGYFPRECRACNKHNEILFGKHERTYNYYKLYLKALMYITNVELITV